MKNIEGLHFADGVAVKRDLQNGRTISIAFADSNKTAKIISNALNWLDEREGEDK